MKKGYVLFIGLLIAAVILTFLSLFISSGTYLLTHNPKAMDFLAFYTGAVLLLKSPANLYTIHSQLITQQHISLFPISPSLFITYVNPPFVALFFVPFVKLGLLNAYALWTIINVILLVIICFLTVKHTTTKKWYHQTLIIIGITTFIPVLTSLLIGQFSILLTLIVLLTWILLKKNREFSSGLVFSLFLIKPQFFILPFILFIMQRRMKVVYGIFCGAVILGLISYFLVGENGIISYIQSLNAAYHGDPRYDPGLMAQHSLQTALLIIFQTQSLSQIYIPWIISLAVIDLPVLFFWTKKFPFNSLQFDYQFALLILATLLTSPHSHFHDLSILVATGVILFSIIYKHKPKQKKMLTALVIAGYCIELIGYLFEVQTRTASSHIWIFVNVGYMLLLWIIILKMLSDKVFRSKN